MIIHFGHCCLSTEAQGGFSDEQKNILYVLPKPIGLDVVETKEQIKELVETEKVNVMVYCDLSLILLYRVAFESDEQISVGVPDSNLIRTVPSLQSDKTEDGVIVKTLLGRKFNTYESDAKTVFLYIGKQDAEEDKVFHKYVLPSIGLDMPIYTLNISE